MTLRTTTIHGEDERFQFSPSICATVEDRYHAWLELNDGECILRTDFGFSHDAEGFLQRPLLVSHNGVVHMLWSEQTADGRWPLAHTSLNDGGLTSVDYLTAGNRRPIDLTASTDSGSLLVAYESMSENGADIRGLRFEDGTWNEEHVLSAEGVDAAHDAAISFNSDGTGYIAYTAFRDGWYEIEARKFDGDSWSEPTTLTEGKALAGYPTVQTLANDGAWFGWTTYEGMPHENTYVTHERRNDQHSFFSGRRITVSHWDGEIITKPKYDISWAPVDEQTLYSGQVFPAENGARPVLLEHDDSLWLVWLEYDTEQSRPHVAASALDGGQWTEPVVVEDTYGDAERLHWTRDPEDGVLIASGNDIRQTGWGTPSEISDSQGQCDVGHVALSAVDTDSRPDRTHNRRIHHTNWDARNPSIPDRDRTNDSGERLIFLDYHRHTDLSICSRRDDGEPALNLRMSRELLRLDSLALTDHCYNNDDLTRFKNARVMELFNWPGSFVTIPSYEWTGSQNTWSGDHYGHLNVHSFENSLPPLGTPTWKESELDTPERLWDRLSATTSLTIPHHTADRRHYFDPNLFAKMSQSPVVEIFQAERGSCELTNGPAATENPDVDGTRHYVQNHLASGVKVGFVGGGDHNGIALGGLWVDELTRRGIYDALRNRRSFATTGTTLALDTQIADANMGEVTSEPVKSVELQIEAMVPDGIQQLDVLYNNDRIHKVELDDRTVDGSFRIALDAECEHHWVYCRVLLSNGEVAWSSPVWITTDP